MDNVDYNNHVLSACHWQKNGFPYFGLFGWCAFLEYVFEWTLL